jgi:glycosyltransferase involved in cell wall biosynthesis
MRVLHLDSGRELRGGQWQVLHLVSGLRAAGCEGVLLARSGGLLLRKAREEGIDARPLRLTALAPLSGRFDLVHAHDGRAHTLAAIAARRPTVVSRRVVFPVGTGALSRWKYRRAARFLAISAAVRAELLRAGIDPGRIDVVYDGVAVPPSPGYDPGGPIVALESADPGKGTALIREAARLAGVNVVFCRDLPWAFRSARLFVYISESEGLGSGALLALAAGIPVLASRVGGLPEIVQDDVTGLTPANEAAGIAAALRRLDADRGLAARLGAAGRALVQSEFTIDRMVARTLDAYRKAIA